jgi:hypothetical protein
MPRNGSGGFSPPTNSWSPAVNGNSATSVDFNALLSDISTAISQSIANDGQTPVTANIPMGNNRLTGLSLGVSSGDSLAWQQLFSQGTESDVPSAATCDIGSINSTFIRITGTSTITSFGATYRGPRFVRFGGVLTLTHNATTLILPGGVNITTAAGDCAIVRPVGSPGDGWVVIAYQPATGYAAKSGNQTITGVTTFASSPVLPGNAVTALEAVPKQQLDAAFPPGWIAAMARLTAPSGWLLIDGKTIGNAASGATSRANDDTAALFAELWAFPAASVPIFDSTGAASTRGASAAADFAANKRIGLFTPDGGAFLRMWAPGQTTDAGRAAGSAQAQALPAITGSAGPFLGDLASAGSGVLTVTQNGGRYAISPTGAGGQEYKQLSLSIGSGADLRPYNLSMPHYIKL